MIASVLWKELGVALLWFGGCLGLYWALWLAIGWLASRNAD